MKERLEKLLDELNKKRDSVLDEYLKILEENDAHRALVVAGSLDDMDLHIRNIHSELKRIGAIEILSHENGKGE